MSDIDPDQMAELCRKTVSFQASEARTLRRSARARLAGCVMSMGMNVALGVAICTVLPLKTFVPIYGFYNEAGLLDTTTELSDLPQTAQVAAIEAQLWKYLHDREGYAPSEAEDAYALVSQLSSSDVKKQYQDWANVKLNPSAPAKKLGKDGFIRINRIGAGWVRHSEDYSSGVYQIRFCRIVAMVNTPVIRQRMNADITFDHITTVPLTQRVTNNWAGIVVTEYPGPREDGAEGVANPCV